MGPRPVSGQNIVALAAFLAAALLFLPAGTLLRYLSVPEGPAPHDAVRAAGAAAAAALHAALVYGPVYRAVGSRVPTGFGAPLAALLGALLPAAARLTLLPRPAGAPLAFVAAHALLVEAALGMGLALLALGTGGASTSAAAAALLWAVRFLVHPVFFGGVVPILELASAIAAAAAVALALRSALAPYRDALLEVPQ